MAKENRCAFLFIFVVILQDVVFCDITDNITYKSVSRENNGGVRELSEKNTTPVLSTRSNFNSTSTVLNPPNSATEPVDWTLENFRKWVNVNYSRRPIGLLRIPDERVRLNSPRARSIPPVQDIYAEDFQHNDVGAWRGYENEASSYYIFKNQKRGSQESMGLSNSYPAERGNVLTGMGHKGRHEDESNALGLRPATSDTEEMTDDTVVRTENEAYDKGMEPEVTPIAEALHSPGKGKYQSNNSETVIDKKEEGINKVSKEPIGKDSVLETLTFIQFSWVDIIIAVCCTAAILLILVNMGVCVQYCLQKKTRGKSFRPYAPPLSTALGMRMDTVPLRKPSLKNRPWVNCHRPFFGRYSPGIHRIMSPSVDTDSHDSQERASTDISMLSLHSTEKGTQYESTDAMIANFVNSDLIVELNDRDSACTSISDGFTFSREYGALKALHNNATDL